MTIYAQEKTRQNYVKKITSEKIMELTYWRDVSLISTLTSKKMADFMIKNYLEKDKRDEFIAIKAALKDSVKQWLLWMDKYNAFELELLKLTQ